MNNFPIPNPPNTSDASLNKWAIDFTKTIELFMQSVSNTVQFPTIAYVNTAKLKPVQGQPVFVPDHPDGPSIIVYYGGVYNRFTAAGVL